MGKQVNFYMMSEDEQEFIKFARSDRQVCIIPETLSSPKVLCLDSLPTQDTAEFWHCCFLWDCEHSSKPVVQHIVQQEYWLVESAYSEVIEFSRSIVDGNWLCRGRIWAEFSLWDLRVDPPVVMQKSKSFEKWYDRLARWIRRKSLRRTEHGVYVLPSADKFVKQGGYLRS